MISLIKLKNQNKKKQMNKKNFKNKFIKLFYKEKIMKNKLFNYKKIAEI